MKECLRYSEIDCKILCIATLCLEEASLADSRGEISFVFSKPFTIAGLASMYFRHLFMEPNSVGLIPPNGYFCETDLQSELAEIYFRYRNQQRRDQGLEPINFSKTTIQGEKRIFGWKVDGFTSDQLFEFDSCFHHAAPCCYSVRFFQSKPFRLKKPILCREARPKRSTPSSKYRIIKCGFLIKAGK